MSIHLSRYLHVLWNITHSFHPLLWEVVVKVQTQMSMILILKSKNGINIPKLHQKLYKIFAFTHQHINDQ